MDYNSGRTKAIRQVSNDIVNKLLDHFDPDKKTIIFLPGGMGSHLQRSRQPYQGKPIPHKHYDAVWMNLGILFRGHARDMEIDDAGRDKNGHIIIPNGALRFLINSYGGTEKFFTDGRNGDYNYAVFGFDWRRSLAEVAGNFEDFLTMFRERGQKRFGRNPLPDTTLLCHSQGGLLGSYFLRHVEEPCDWFERMITIGSPMYGTMVQQRRYYNGQAPLSQLYGAKEVARISATLPGPYSFMCMDRQTYQDHGREIGLDAYPSLDPDGRELDPYDPVNLPQYPSWIKPDLLQEGRRVFRTIASPLAADVAKRYFNIRATRLKTPHAQMWKPLPNDYDPDIKPEAPFEYTEVDDGGDGTVPTWSAWHLDTPECNRIELKSRVDHQDMAELTETLRIVKRIIDTGSPEGADLNDSDRAYGKGFLGQLMQRLVG